MSRPRIRPAGTVVGKTRAGNDVVLSARGNYYIKLSTGEPMHITEEQFNVGIRNGDIVISK